MKKHLYIISGLLSLFAGNLSSQVTDRPVLYTYSRDSVSLESHGFHKTEIINGDTIFAYVPEIWGLNSEAKIVNDRRERKLVRSGYYDYSDLSHIPDSHAIDRSKDPGDIRIVRGGSSGALAYTVPFDMYLTQSGFNPEIYLAYNSLSNNGTAGFGWQIGGLSSISATNSVQYFDNANAPAKLSRSSAFLLDGIRLIDLKTGTGETINYETERGKIKVTAYLSGDHIKYFTVKYPDGRTGTFGYTTNTENKVTYPLTRMEDLKGNLINYSYREEGHTCYPDEIRYGGKNTSVAHFASIRFTYEDRHDVTSFFIDGQELRASKRLKEVCSYFDNREIRKYRLSYDTSSPVSLLKQIDCLSEDRSLNPLIFYYGENQRIERFEKSEVLLDSYFENSSVPDLCLSKGKFSYGQNNDGLISYPNISNWDVIAIKTNWLGKPIAYQYGSKFAADQSLLIYNGLSSGWISPTKLMAEEGFLQLSAADVDGDGADEIVKINSTLVYSDKLHLFKTERLTFKVYGIVRLLGEYQARLKYEFSVDFGGVCSWEGLDSPSPKNYIVGDFLGSGKQSVLCLSYNKNAKGETVSSQAMLVDIDGRKKSETHNKTCFSYDFQDRVYSLDFDGDGKMDICHISNDGTEIYSFDPSGQLIEIAGTNSIRRSSLSGRELLLGDINGDGKTDLVLSPKKNDYTYKTTEIPCGVCEGCRKGGGTIRPEEPYPVLRNLDESDSHNHDDANRIELGKDSIKISSFALKRPIDAVDSYCSNPQIYREKIYNTSSTIWSIYYSTGKGFSLKTRDIIRYEGDIKFALQDMNGDNIPDLVVNNSGTISMYLTNNGILNTKVESQTCNVDSKAHFITGSIEQGYKMSQLFSLYDYKLVPVTFTRNDARQHLLTGKVVLHP